MNLDNNQFKCKTHNTVAKMVAPAIVTLIILLGITCGIYFCNSKIIVYVLLFFMILFSATFCVLISAFIVLVRVYKNCHLIADSNTIRLQDKKGYNVIVERKVQDIKKIVILNSQTAFGEFSTIVLVDDIGEFGKGLFTKSGEYIKLQYNEKKLQNLRRFLPHCETEIKNGKNFNQWTE